MARGIHIRSAYYDIDEKTRELRKKINRNKEAARIFFEKLELSWIFHDNALEGLVLDVYDLKAALDHSTTEDGVLIPIYQKIRNHKNAIEKVRNYAEHSSRAPSLIFIKNLHAILRLGLSYEPVGVYRKDIPIHRMYFHDIAPPQKIPQLMTKLLQHIKTKEFKQYHPIRQASDVHLTMMGIFPFDEETGKVVRLVMNYFAMRAGYFPVIIPDIDRQRYFDSLRLSPHVLHELMVECMQRQLDLSLRFFKDGTMGRW